MYVTGHKREFVGGIGLLCNISGYPRHRENRENGPQKESLSGKFCQNTGNLFAQVVNALFLKVKDIVIFVAKKSFFPRSWIGLPSQFCVCNSHTLCQFAQ